MNWDNPRVLDAICYDLVLSDWYRGQNRARIADLANGAPPYSQAEVEDNNIVVNVSDLTHTRMMHDARSQYANAFIKGGILARAKTDAGPVHKRQFRSAVVNKEWNKCVRESVPYFERRRAAFGNTVLHGISPAVWQNQDGWRPIPIGVEDVLLPGETLLGFENLPFIVIRRSFTSIELYSLTNREKRDPGWNMPFVDKLMAWLNEQTSQLRALNWPDVWAPEKIMERTKSEAGGTLAGDRAPKIDVFDIYAFDNSGGEEGWIRRMILNSWSEPNIPSPKPDFNRKQGVMGDTNSFLFTSGKKKVARNWNQIAAFQFADLSAVFPARYHSVRGLGWMLYAACHLGNRLRCKFYESVLEALNMLFEVDSQQDAQNALKLNLVNRGFIDKTIRPVKAQDRWQVNSNLVELGLRDNAMVISENAASFVQSRNYSQDRTEKTRFQVMAELQAATSLVSAALNQAFQYQTFESKEIFRRFCRKNSTDPDVRSFRAKCLKQGVPEYMLNDASAWDIESERTMGGGNKTLELQIAEWLMTNRAAFDSGPQRDILRRSTLAWTDDPGLAISLVPEEPEVVTEATRDAEYIAATLMAGVNVEPLDGEDNIQIIERLLLILAQKVEQGLNAGGMVPPQQLAGLQAIAQQIGVRIQKLAEDDEQKAKVKQYASTLSQLMNHLKAFEQRLMAAAKAQASGNGQGQMDPKDIAKVQGMQLEAQTKAQLTSQSHAQRTAQRQVAFEQKLRQQAEQHQADLAATDLEAATNIRRNKLMADNEETPG